MKLKDLFRVLQAVETVKVYDMDPDDAKPGDALFDGFAINMRLELGELFDSEVIAVFGSYVDPDIVIQIEEVSDER